MVDVDVCARREQALDHRSMAVLAGTFQRLILGGVHVRARREQAIKPSGKEVTLSFVRIETPVCTGCDLCVKTCAPGAIIPASAKPQVIELYPRNPQ